MVSSDETASLIDFSTPVVNSPSVKRDALQQPMTGDTHVMQSTPVSHGIKFSELAQSHKKMEIELNRYKAEVSKVSCKFFQLLIDNIPDFLNIDVYLGKIYVW